MTTYWFPAHGHPDGTARDRPWFRVEDEWGYRAHGHPAGPSEQPCFHLEHGRVTPVLSLPGDVEAEISFVVVGSFVYQAGAGGAPWFRVQAGRPGGDAAGTTEPGAPAPSLVTRRDLPSSRAAHRPGFQSSPTGATKGAAVQATMAKHEPPGSTRRHGLSTHAYQDVNPPVDGCPTCGSPRICWVPASEGQMNYLCEGCGRCWARTVNGTVRVSPISCPGCAHRDACFEHLRSEIAAFAWRPA